MHTFSLFAFLIIFVGFQYAECQKLSCNAAGLKQVDAVSSKFLNFGDDLKFPSNAAELTKYCSDLRANGNTIKEFSTKCFKGLSKTLHSVTVHNVAKSSKGYCNNDKKKAEFTQHMGKCGNANRKDTQKCMADAVDIYHRAKNINDKQKFNLICCNYYVWKDCTMDALRKSGTGTCPEASIKYINDFVDKGANDALKLLCNDSFDVKTCPSIWKAANIPKAKGPSPWKSPLLAVNELLGTI